MMTYNNTKVIHDYNEKEKNFESKTFIQDVGPVLNRIAEQYQMQTDEINKLKKEIKNFKADVYKDEELQRMETNYKIMKTNYLNGFPITFNERIKINQWIKDHENDYHDGCPVNQGVSGGGYEYVFYPCGLGVSGNCYCTSCKRKAMEEAKGDFHQYVTALKKHNAYFSFREFD